jgi:hypothetical protein
MTTRSRPSNTVLIDEREKTVVLFHFINNYSYILELNFIFYFFAIKLVSDILHTKNDYQVDEACNQ